MRLVRELINGSFPLPVEWYNILLEVIEMRKEMVITNKIGTKDLNDKEAQKRILNLVNAIMIITDKGNNAEVKRKSNGELTVYEVKKNIVSTDN